VGWKPRGIKTGLAQSKVEREPMWDGNVLERRAFSFIRMSVEREPMWDGN